MAKEYGPQYYIRIFPRLGDVRCLNPNNVISITTSKDIYQQSGTWNIEFDYREGAMEQNSWFFNIEPMDYVEIFMRRESVFAYAAGVERDWGFGVYDTGEMVTGSDGKKRWTGKWLGTFEKVAIDWDTTKSVVLPNSDSADPVYGFDTKQRPLTINEKINNPDFIMCGYVDRISNKFSIVEGGTHNLIRLEGRGVEKMLAVHNFFFNIQYQEEWLKKMISAFLYIPRMTPAIALDFILTVFMQGALDPQGETLEFDKEGRSITGRDYQVKLEQIQTGTEIVEVTDPKTKKKKKVPKPVMEELEPKIIHDSAPSCNQIYWAAITNPKYTWGRMYDLYPEDARAVGNIKDGPVWSIMQQFCNSALNELWVDETGNLVCRSALVAWSQPPADSFSAVPIDKQVQDCRPWITVRGGEIRSWDFTRSDDDLKTIVQVIPSASIFGTIATTSGLYGQAPITETSKNFMKATIQRSIDDKTALITPATREIYREQLKELDQDFNAAQNLIATNVSSFKLQNEDDVQSFWARFGVRPHQVNDIYSVSPLSLVRTAGIVFQFWANTFWSGNVTLRGDSRFKLGRMVNFPDLNKNATNKNGDPITGGAVFYCHRIDHNFTWGEDWTTTLGLTRGQLTNTYLDHLIDFKTTTPTREY